MKFKSSQLVSATNQLKLPAADGKKYLADVADTEQILRLIQSIPSGGLNMEALRSNGTALIRGYPRWPRKW